MLYCIQLNEFELILNDLFYLILQVYFTSILNYSWNIYAIDIFNTIYFVK